MDQDDRMLDSLPLVDDLRLLWFDPVNGTLVHRGTLGTPTHRKTLSAAMLFDLLNTGAATFVPGRTPRRQARLVARGLATPRMVVVAAETPPAEPALVPAWESLRKLRRPRTPERAMSYVRRPIDPDARLIGAGVVERLDDGTRRLSAAGLQVARSRRAELDAVVLGGTRSPLGVSPRTAQLGALLSLTGGEWTAVWPSMEPQQRASAEIRLVELRRELVLGGDAAAWGAIERALRQATTDPTGV